MQYIYCGIPGTVYLILRNQGHNTIVFSNPCEFQERDSAFRRNQVKPPPQIAPGLSSVSFSNAMRYLLNDPPRSKLRYIWIGISLNKASFGEYHPDSIQ